MVVSIPNFSIFTKTYNDLYNPPEACGYISKHVELLLNVDRRLRDFVLGALSKQAIEDYMPPLNRPTILVLPLMQLTTNRKQIQHQLNPGKKITTLNKCAVPNNNGRIARKGVKMYGGSRNDVR